MSCTVSVVPMSAPRMTPSVWRKVMRPADTKPISMIVVADDDCRSPVTITPDPTAISRLRDSPVNRWRSRASVARCRLSPLSRMPYSNKAIPPNSARRTIMACACPAPFEHGLRPCYRSWGRPRRGPSRPLPTETAREEPSWRVRPRRVSSAGFARATWGEVRKGGEAPLRGKMRGVVQGHERRRLDDRQRAVVDAQPPERVERAPEDVAGVDGNDTAVRDDEDVVAVRMRGGDAVDRFQHARAHVGQRLGAGRRAVERRPHPGAVGIAGLLADVVDRAAFPRAE